MALPSEYKAVKYMDSTYGSIGSIYITAAGFINREFKGVSPNSSFGWQELVWKKTPSRGANFKFTNMDRIDVGLIARCEIDVSFMTPDDYRDMRKILKQRHYLITFYDMDEQEWVTRDMYCSENTKSKFLILNQSILGTIDFKLKFVGTNLDTETIIDSNGNETQTLKMVNIEYIENGESTKNQAIVYGGQIELEYDTEENAPAFTYFYCWVTKDDNGNVNGYYGLGQSITVWKNLKLYPYFKEI